MQRVFAALFAFAFAFAFAATAGAATPSQQDKDWLDSRQAIEFRDRVVQLALIYGESSGIDLRGYKIETRQMGAKDANDCGDVEVVTRKSDEVVRRETLRACKRHPG